MRLPITPVSIMNFFFMLGVSFVLTFDSNLFEGNRDTTMYEFFLEVSPQEGYGIFAFAVAVVIFTAFILKNCWFEIVGLFLSGLFLLFILSGYLLTFPNIGSIAFFVWTLASFMTIVDILNRLQDKKDRRRRILDEMKKETFGRQLLIGQEISYDEVEKAERVEAEREKMEVERLELLEEEVKRHEKRQKRERGE